MDVIVKKSELKGETVIPPSKSVAHRKMICAFLAGGCLNVDGGKDAEATARCLSALLPCLKKFKLFYCDNGVADVEQVFDNRADSKPVLNAGESGSTLRFLLPVVCALGAEVVFEGEGRLKDRPLSGLINSLTEHGAKIEKIGTSGLPLKVSGKLNSGEYVIDGGVSSQYVTGLLLALPLLDGDSKIIVRGESVSKNYIDITLDVLAEFGVTVKVAEYGYFISGNQKYVLPDDLEIESDWSSAGFMIALGVLTGELRLSGLKMQSLQGDKSVVGLLRRAGADIVESDGVLTVRKSRLTGVDFDAQDCPDAVPIMATVLSFSDGASRISHVDRLRDKESDRLTAVREMLSAFGIKTEYSEDVLTVYRGEHRACDITGFDDHRMAMSAIVCALATDGTSVVRGVECIAKSYPSFISDITKLGADVKII